MQQKVMQVFLALLGIWPFYSTKTLKPSVIYIVSLITCDVLLLLYWITTLSGNFADVNYYFNGIVASTVHAVLVFTFGFRKVGMFQKLLNLLCCIDDGLTGLKFSTKLFETVTFLVLILCYWIAVILILVMPKVRLHISTHMVLVLQFQSYTILMTAWLAYTLLSVAYTRFVTINKILTGTTSTLTLSQLAQEINQISKLHVQLCDFVDILNDLFGWFLLYYFVMTFTSILTAITFLRLQDMDNIVEMVPNLALLGCVLVNMLLVAFKAEDISVEGDKFVANSQRSMVQYSNFYQVKCQFHMLAQQGRLRTPAVSAAGFFCYNRAMVYMLINLVATYVIVTIQFIPLKDPDTQI